MAELLLSLLMELIETAGVSGSEDAVAAVVERRLAEAGFSTEQIERDYLGNRWVRVGPSGIAQRLLVAHMDEIGLRVTSIRPDGICRVQAVGGIDPQLWEGSAVVVYTAAGPLYGCIAPVSLHVTGRSNLAPSSRLKIEDLLLDIGASSAEQVAELGVSVLDAVTWPKKLTLLGGGLAQGRSMDDRFGCTALLALATRLRENSPVVPTVLAWSVQEEVGLRGARALARSFPQCAEVIAVDSFTIGGGPRDNRQYDAVLLGGGPALRAWDASTLMPQQAWRDALARAEAIGVPLQHGYMQGGNDASVFEDSGAAVLGIGVPVQYSHSAVERIHLRDLDQLVELLAGWCAAA